MFKQRLLTAMVLAPLALAAVFLLPVNYFALVMALVLAGGGWEWSRLSGVETSIGRVAYSLVVALIGLAGVVQTLVPLGLILGMALLLWLVILYWVVRYPQPGVWRFSASRLVLGVLVMVPAMLALVALKGWQQGDLYLLLLMLLVWGADVGAYFAGKNFGKTKLAVDVSPGKTREGLYGGLLTCLIVGCVFAYSQGYDFATAAGLAVLAVLVGLQSVLGDLFESLLKRHTGIKDSGSLLPGHGGILDRIDSLLAAAPLLVMGLYVLL